MVNLQCRVLILMAHLKKKCQCRPEDCIDLLDEMGALMNLSKVENPACEFTSKYLQERERYILIRVVRGESSEATCYESLLENLGKHYPDLRFTLPHWMPRFDKPHKNSTTARHKQQPPASRDIQSLHSSSSSTTTSTQTQWTEDSTHLLQVVLMALLNSFTTHTKISLVFIS
ncbi:hypothetical protein GRJ2_002154500 [Grus japonensis]|uniref:Uncharacterized protein n=1 Tax=Grus japonensis TaxID=30415 RepID=A0ABC9XHN2_GRUJA